MTRLATGVFLIALLSAAPGAAQSNATGQSAAAPGEIEIEVHIIGFGVDANTERQLRDMSKAAGGQYYNSSVSGDLTSVLGKATGVIVAGTSSQQQIPPDTRESEPNGRAEAANAANPSGTITGKFEARGDSDFYLIDIPSAGEWTINVSRAPGDYQLALGVYPAAGGSWLRNHSQDATRQLIADLPAPGRYILRVREKNSKSGAESYQLSSVFTPVPDQAEPNNRAEIANQILADKSVTGAILPVGDVDYYAFDAPQSGEWTISIDEQPPNFQIGLGVYPATGGSWYPDRSGKGDNRLVVDLPAAGRYILKVNELNKKRSVAAYRLDMKFAPSADKFEPNNRAEIAGSVPGTGEISGTILPAGDVDFFVFNTGQAGEWSIAITGKPQNWQIGLGVYPANGGSWLPDRSEKGDSKLVVDLPAPGRYILKANELNNKRSVEPYRLEAVFTPAGDAFEPNNNPAIAKPVPANGTVVATFLPAGDNDYFLVNIDTPGQLTIEIAGQPQNMSVGLGVYPAAGGSWLRDKSEKGDGKLVVDLPAAGHYILRASEANSKRSVEQYTLRMQFQ